MRFEDLGLSAGMLATLRGIQFPEPTPIQVLPIPAALHGRDIVGCAQTGTGKTAAFGIPMLERLKGGRHFRGLVLAPTRELAVQIGEHLTALARGTGLRVATVHGGVPVRDHIQHVRTHPDVLVATPGRLLDLQRQGALRLEGVEILVLDEADRMLDMGFADELNAILRSLAPERQTMLFSATMPAAVRQLVRTGVRNPVTVEVAPHLKPLESVVQRVQVVPEGKKPGALAALLKEEQGSVLVFTGTRQRTERLAHAVRKAGFQVACIHGNMLQEARNRALGGFRSGRYRVLVATDVASRGLDIDGIAHVVNFDLPGSADDFIHRIGRTARAGASGRATTFLTPRDRQTLRRSLATMLGQGPAGAREGSQRSRRRDGFRRGTGRRPKAHVESGV